MILRRLSETSELEKYREEFAASFKRQSPGETSTLPLEYLQASQVFGAFDAKGKMVAGYTLGTHLPLRLLEFVPVEKRASLIVPFSCSWNDCCEITVAWKLPEVSLLFMSSRFWPHALIGVLQSGKKILLGHNQNARLDKFYTALGPATIYSGVSSFGHPSRLFAYNRWRMVICILGLWVFETPRRLLMRGGK